MRKNNEEKDFPMEFANLGVQLDADEVAKSPLIFIPGIVNKTTTLENEPYGNIVSSSMKIYAESFNFDESSEINYIRQFLFKQFMNNVMTNAHIILNSGLLSFIETYSTPEAKRSDLYKSYMNCSVFTDNIFCDHVYTSLVNNFLFENYSKDIFIKGISEVRALYATKISNWLYYFINEITMNGYIDINSMGSYMVFGQSCDTNNIVRSDQIKALEISYHSVCVDGLLEMANSDLSKICEIIEPAFVHLFYNVMDFRYYLKQIRRDKNISE